MKGRQRGRTRLPSDARHVARSLLALCALSACEPATLLAGQARRVADAGAGEPLPTLPDAAPPGDASPPSGDATLPSDAGDVATGQDAQVSVGLAACEAVFTGPTQASRNTGQLTAETLEARMCEPSELGEALSSGVYHLRDDGVLLRAGQHYSVRWDMAVAHRFDLMGGALPCATEPVYTEPPTIGYGLPAPACRSFVAPRDITYLRIPEGNIGIYFTGAQLCPGPCPGEEGVDAGAATTP